MALVIRIRLREIINGPPFHGFYKVLGTEWRPEYDDYLVLQIWRNGFKIIVLDLKNTQEIASALQHAEDKLEIITIIPLEEYIQQIMKKLTIQIGNDITIKSKTLVKTTPEELMHIAKILNSNKYKIIQTSKNTFKIELNTKITAKNLKHIAYLTTIGIGKNKSLGYGTLIWNIQTASR